ncbi:MAG: FtsX-like permease family protein [Gammaproteobacteria bacterium]
MKYLALILSNLKRRKLRTVLTVLSITVAFLLFGYLSAIRQGFLAGVEVAGVDRPIVRHKISIIQFLPESYLDRIERIDGVDNAMYSTWFGGIYQKPSNFFAQVPVDPEELFDMFPEYRLSDAEREAWLKTRTGAIVGSALAERFGWNVGDRIPLMAPIWPSKEGGSNWTFDLVGVYEGAEQGTDTSQMFFRYDYFDEMRAGGQGMVGWYTVRVADPDRAAEVAAAIDAEFANSPAETKTEPEGAFLQGFTNQIGDIAFIITAIVGAVFFTILLVAGNTMAYMVRERTGELAVLKAIGFTDRGVLLLVLGESLVLAAAGGILGLGLAVMLVAAGDPTNGLLPVFFISPKDVLTGLGLILGLAVVAGILPALQARRLQVADALRR